MTIFCDWPRGLVCDACGAKIALPHRAMTDAAYDAAMRDAGWVEYAPRFVAKLFGGHRHATQLHTCGPCLVKLSARQVRLRSASLESCIDGRSTPKKLVERAVTRLDRELAQEESL